jgi:Bacterial mobilisation protein (MobC)
MGRPKVSSLRDMQLKLNLTAAEYECVLRRAKAAGMRPGHFSRALVLNTAAAPTQEEAALSNTERLNYLALSRVGNNLNQITRRMHQTGEEAPADLEPLLADIRQIINRAAKKWL